MTFNPTTVTLPTVIGTRFTDAGLFDGFVFADYNATESDMVTNPEDAVQYNTARFTTLSSTSGAITVEPDGTTTKWDWNTDTYTAGANVWTIGEQGFMEVHVATNDAANAGGTGKVHMITIIRQTGALGNTSKWIEMVTTVGSANESVGIEYPGATASTFGSIVPTDGQLDTGYWYLHEAMRDGSVRTSRVAGAAGARPAITSYSVLDQRTFFTVPQSLDVGFVVENAASDGTDDKFILSGLRVGRSLPVTIV